MLLQLVRLNLSFNFFNCSLWFLLIFWYPSKLCLFLVIKYFFVVLETKVGDFLFNVSIFMLFYFAFNLAFLVFLTKSALDFQMNLNGGENQFEPEDISLPYMVFFLTCCTLFLGRGLFMYQILHLKHFHILSSSELFISNFGWESYFLLKLRTL